MKFHLRIMIAICTTLLSLASVPAKAAEKTPPRLVLAADNGWKFTLGDPSGAGVTFLYRRLLVLTRPAS